MKQYSAVWEKEKLIADLAAAKKWSRVLDFGAGNGAYVPILLNQAKEVYCLENNRGRLKQLKKRFAQDKRIKLAYSKSRKLPFETKYFDLVWASEVLEHQTDFSLVEEWERASKNLLVITIPNPSGPYWRRDKTHILRYSFKNLNQFFQHRKNFFYQVYGLGFCWPARFDMIFLRKIFLKLTWRLPRFAWTWLILGQRKRSVHDRETF